MRLTSGWAVIVFVAAVAMIVAVVVHGTAAASCADADDLTAAGLYDDGRKVYESILDDEADSHCAVEGLLTIADRQCAVATAIWNSGATEQAEKAFTKLLDVQPLSREDAKALDDVDDREHAHKQDARQCALDGLRWVREAKQNDRPKEKACPCPAACASSCSARDEREHQDPEHQDPERQDPEHQDPEHQDPEHQDPEHQEPAPCPPGRLPCTN
jgi:hypothetical protein